MSKLFNSDNARFDLWNSVDDILQILKYDTTQEGLVKTCKRAGDFFLSYMKYDNEDIEKFKQKLTTFTKTGGWALIVCVCII